MCSTIRVKYLRTTSNPFQLLPLQSIGASVPGIHCQVLLEPVQPLLGGRGLALRHLGRVPAIGSREGDENSGKTKQQIMNACQ